MSISSTSRKAGPYTGDGLTTVFPFNFKVFQASDLLVVQTDRSGVESNLSLTTDYTVNLNANQDSNPGGSITCVSAPAFAFLITLTSNVPELQPVVLTNMGGFYPTVINDALDRLTIFAQQLSEQVSRAVKIGISDTGSTDPNTVLSTIAAEAAAVQTNYNSFFGTYYGPYATAPTVDPLGNAIGYGDLYYNTTLQALQVYTSTGWTATAQATPTSYTTQLFNGTSAQTAFTLSASPASIAATEVFISGVRQRPTTDYTLSGSTLTFVAAPASGTNNIFVRWTAAIAVGVPNDGSVSTVKIQDSAVATAKIQDQAVTTAKISDANVTSAKIQDQAITQSKLASGLLCGTKNRLINGAMQIDQRNNGASVSGTTSGYTNGYFFPVDRWKVLWGDNAGFTVSATAQQNLNAYTPPAGFKNYIGFSYMTGSDPSDYIQFCQVIEGVNCADLNWGSANAKACTLSFWIRLGSTGTYSGYITNGIIGSLSYLFTFTVSAANTWEYKTISIPGPTSGTWATDTTAGITIGFFIALGASTGTTTANTWIANTPQIASGASQLGAFYITGVQFEIGNVASAYESRAYGTELALCQRYYFKSYPAATGKNLTLSGYTTSTTSAVGIVHFPVSMRISPTYFDRQATANMYAVATPSTTVVCSAPPALNTVCSSTDFGAATFTVAAGLTANQPANGRTDVTNGALAYLGWSAEL